ncbi:hypothetical protein EP7_002894 [Isosphaeraceae bacterium EP7]
MPIRTTRVMLSVVTAGILSCATAQAQQDAESLPGPEPLAPVMLANTLPTKPIRRTAKGFQDPLDRKREVFNEQWIDTRTLPSDRATQLGYTEQTADFTVGKTVTGETSKATAVITGKDVDDQGAGTLTLARVSGEFQNGENLADDAGGAAKVRGKLREGVWVLDFAFKPLRIQTVEVPGKGRKEVLYLYYQVVNRTGKPRAFIPEFTLAANGTGKKYPDTVMPEAVKQIQNREDPSTPLLGAVDVMGMIPPSDQPGLDKAVFGVAVWDKFDAKADVFSIYVRGLTDYSFTTPPTSEGGKPVVKYKTLRIDFRRRGDEINLNEKEIELLEPPYEWVYW